MSLAYDLVNSLAASQTEVDDKTLVIDHYTRTIIIPSGIKSLGVENDDDVLRLNFRMPRYLGTVDLYNFKIYVNYINAQGKDDVYEVDDATIVGDNVAFSWQVGPTATAYIGTTSFNVRMTITDADSTIKQEYNTAVAKLPVLQGLKCSKRAVSKYSDILAQWERKLFGISGTEEAKLVAASEAQQQHIVDKGNEVLSTIPEEYTATYNLANESARTKADAIICSAQGETLTVSDSSDDYLRGLKVFGKTTQVKTNGYQMFDANNLRSNTLLGVTVTNNGDGSFTVYGSGTLTGAYSNHTYDYSHEETVRLLRPGTYTLKSERITHPYVYVQLRNSSGNVLNITSSVNPVSSNIVTQEMLDDPTLYLRIGFYGVEGTTIATGTVKPMLYIDGDGTWEPYSGGYASPSPGWPQEIVNLGDDGNIGVTVYGKNLITYPYQDPSGTVNNGITYTVNNDGSVTVNGTATANSSFSLTSVKDIIPLPVGWVYTSLGNGHGNGIVQIQNDIFKDGVYVATLTNSLENASKRQLTQPHEIRGVRLKVLSGVTVNNAVVYPMLSLAEPITSYEQYRGKQSLTVMTENALPGIPVTSGGNYTDSNGQQWISDEIDFERGMYVQKVGQFTLSNDRIYYYNTDTAGKEFFYTANGDNVKAWETRMYCSHFPVIGGSVSMESDYWMQVSGSGGIRFRHKDLTSLNALATWLVNNSVHVCYVLNTPIETPLTADEIAAFKAIKSNYPNTTVLNDAGARMFVRYNADTETWINNLIDEKIAAAVAKL